jgi:hypothetical protein
LPSSKRVFGLPVEPVDHIGAVAQGDVRAPCIDLKLPPVLIFHPYSLTPANVHAGFVARVPVVTATRDHKSLHFADPEEGYFLGCRNFGFHSYLPGMPPWTILSA